MSECKITEEYWVENIRSRFNETPNMVLESLLIEFGSKALEKLANLKSENERLKKERLLLAKLASEEPQFYNPLVVADVKKLRDEILKGGK